MLLLDEPLGAGHKVQYRLREEIRRLQTQLGITTLFVTHDQEEALTISDRVVVLSQGRIEQVGPPTEIYGNPKTPFVAQFVGTMNRIESTVPSGISDAVEAGGLRLPAHAARDWRANDRVLLLLRPEAMEVSAYDDPGAGAPGSGIEGVIKSQIFLGSVTRLYVATAVGELTADMGSLRALASPVGSRVILHWKPEAPRLISLGSDTNGSSSAGTASSAVAREATVAARK